MTGAVFLRVIRNFQPHSSPQDFRAEARSYGSAQGIPALGDQAARGTGVPI